MTFEEFLSDLKVDFSKYFESDLIDDLSVLRWVNQALKKFGGDIMNYQTAVVEVENYKAKLPENFYALKLALKCDKDYISTTKEDEVYLKNSLFWTDVQIKKKSWDVCTDCEKDTEVEEFTIREDSYINGRVFRRHYKNPIKLRLSKSMTRRNCVSDLENTWFEKSPFEINIIGNTLHTNFKEGDVYVKYLGSDLDEEGLPIIPDTPKGELATYVMYYVKRNILEIAMSNGDDANIATLFQYYNQKELSQIGLAMTDVKFSKVSPSSLYKMVGRNQAERKRFERLPR